MSTEIEQGREMLRTKQAELKEAEASLELLVSITDVALQLFEGAYPRQEIKPTVAADGSPRLVGYTMDDDAYSGHFSQQAIHGATLIGGRQLVVEEFFPSGRLRNTYLTNIDLQTGEVSAHTEPNDGSSQVPLEGTTRVEGAAKLKELRQVQARLQSYADKYTSGLDKGLGRSTLERNPYEFRTEQLR